MCGLNDAMKDFKHSKLSFRTTIMPSFKTDLHLFLDGMEYYRIKPPAQCGTEGSVKLLLTKNPACSLPTRCLV